MSPNVERWRQAVDSELLRQNIPLPVNLVLGVIWTESRGKPGITHPKSGASGLMQVMPKTLNWYNKQNPNSSVTLNELRSTDYGIEQIRVGIWVMGQFWKGAYKYLKKRMDEIPTEQLWKIADLFYVAGPGAVKKKLDKISPPFFEIIEQNWPNWNALPHPHNVGKQMGDVTWDLNKISQWLQGSITKEKTAKGLTILLLLLALVFYWWYLKGQKDKKNDKETEKNKRI